MKHFETLLKTGDSKCAEVEAKLAVELDGNHLKKMVIGMVDTRLGALEAHSQEALKIQSASLEILRQLQTCSAPPPTQPTGLSITERERILADFSKVLERKD